MKKLRRLLVVDDEPSMRLNITDILQMEGHSVEEAGTGNDGILKALSGKPDIILLDFNLPDMDGLKVLSEVKKEIPDILVIILTAYGTNERVIATMKAGAFDYVEKPFELSEFLIILERAFSYLDMQRELEKLRLQADAEKDPVAEQIIGKSAAMKKIMKTIGLAAASSAAILIQGESGTGKELVADAIQRHSDRVDMPYIKINCGAFAESLLESEIFGHEKGSFTGASELKQGKFELASGGTVFLDEINNMPQSLQVRLLRILQQQSFFRVGGKELVQVDVRIIAASNRVIEDEIEAGNLRKDLYYRLNVIRINIPPLRERTEDIPLLIDFFIKKHSPNRNLAVPQDVLEKLKALPWHGNVRELENHIQRAIVLARDNALPIDIPAAPRPGEVYDVKSPPQPGGSQSFRELVSEYEKELILNALRQSNGNRSAAAKLLRMSRRLLYYKIKDLKIEEYT